MKAESPRRNNYIHNYLPIDNKNIIIEIAIKTPSEVRMEEYNHVEQIYFPDYCGTRVNILA